MHVALPPPSARRPILRLAALLAGAGSGLFAPDAAGAAPAVPARPNILFIVSDDLGYGDVACYGNPHLETPVLDRLAREGVRLTDYYAASPLCAPSRAAMLTGRFNHRTGAIDVSSNRGIDRIALSEKTFGDYFRHAGYRTAHLGKWHSGLYCDEYLPHRRGFDLFYGFANGAHDYWKWQLMRNGRTEVADGRYLTDALTDEAIAFIEQSGARPWAIFLAHLAGHVPLQAPEPLIEKYRARSQGRYTASVAVLYAMIEAMDTSIGRILTRLEQLGLREKTLVVFTSDNGAHLGASGEGANESMARYHGPFRGNKDNVLEQGIRVPAIVAWPGTIPRGQVLSTPAHGCDWLPTFYGRTGHAPPPGALPFDGADLFPILRGEPAGPLAQRALPFQKNRYTPVALSDAAIREGRWKLFWPGIASTIRKDGLRDNWAYHRGIVRPHWEMPLDPDLPDYGNPQPAPAELYDLHADPGETRNVAADHPEIVRTLAARYDAWFAEVGAEWRRANQAIREHDRQYWKDRTPPDPRTLVPEFLKPRPPAGKGGADPADLLRQVPGYWQYPEYAGRWPAGGGGR